MSRASEFRARQRRPANPTIRYFLFELIKTRNAKPLPPPHEAFALKVPLSQFQPFLVTLKMVTPLLVTLESVIKQLLASDPEFSLAGSGDGLLLCVRKRSYSRFRRNDFQKVSLPRRPVQRHNNAARCVQSLYIFILVGGIYYS